MTGKLQLPVLGAYVRGASLLVASYYLRFPVLPFFSADRAFKKTLLENKLRMFIKLVVSNNKLMRYGPGLC